MSNLFLASNAFLTLEKGMRQLSMKGAGRKAAFIPTAADLYGEKPWMWKDRSALEHLGFDVKDVDIRNKNYGSLIEELHEAHVIFVAGGNVFYLLHHVRASGFDRAASELVEKGALYAGSSAGSVLAGEDISAFKYMDDPGWAPPLKSTKALGLAGFTPLVHWGNAQYRSAYMKTLGDIYDKGGPFIPLRDNEAIVIKNGDCRIIEA